MKPSRPPAVEVDKPRLFAQDHERDLAGIGASLSPARVMEKLIGRGKPAGSVGGTIMASSES